MVAMGIVPRPKDSLGCEAAGVVTRVGSSISHVTEGDRVFVVQNGLFATRKTVPGQCVAKIPEALSFEEAVTMPIVYLTAIYAIVTLGQMQKGQSILIHSGTGGVGQAAITICQTLDVEASKRRHIRENKKLIEH
jgi:NADPH:quinone reductase-like Zn-dependent oxidoreductase